MDSERVVWHGREHSTEGENKNKTITDQFQISRNEGQSSIYFELLRVNSWLHNLHHAT